MVKVKFVQYPPVINGTYMKDTPNLQIGFQKFEIEKKVHLDEKLNSPIEMPPPPCYQIRRRDDFYSLILLGAKNISPLDQFVL